MNHHSLKHIFFFLLFCVVYLGIVFFLGDRIRDPKMLLASLTDLYARFGYSLVFLAGVLEGMFLVGMYIPGSAIIYTGIALSKTGAFSPLGMALLGNAGLLVGFCINYVLGKYGWYQLLISFGLETKLNHAKEQLIQYEKKALFFGFISPFPGTFLATAAGMLQLPFWGFFRTLIVVQLFWGSLWALLVYYFGIPFVELFLRYFSLVMLVGLGVVGFQTVVKKNK